MRNNKGFTLIELIITIAIMGILAGIIIPSYNQIQENAKNTAAKSTALSLQMAIETYYLQQGSYPTGQSYTLSKLVSDLQNAGTLKQSPQNPFTGQAYTDSDGSGKITYTYTTASNSYEIKVQGKGNTAILSTLTNL